MDTLDNCPRNDRSGAEYVCVSVFFCVSLLVRCCLDALGVFVFEINLSTCQLANKTQRYSWSNSTPSRGTVGQSVECPSKGPGSVQFC